MIRGTANGRTSADQKYPDASPTESAETTPATEMKTSDDVIPVVILNWNGEDDTVECLTSISTSAPAGFVPVVVDNASAPESVERLMRECRRLFARVLILTESELLGLGSAARPQLRSYLGDNSLVFIENKENRGFAKGNNIAIRFAELIGSDWVLLLNNDTVVAPSAFQELRRFRDHYAAFVAITAQVRNYKPSTRIQHCGGDLTYFGRQKYKFAGRDASLVPESGFSVITFITGCVLLFNYKIAGVLSEDFFFGEEDYEFSLRMQKLGLEMACVHGAVVYHKGGASIARSSRPLGAILLYYVNRLINTRNYYSKFRWHATRILAYLYLPILFGRKGIDIRYSLSAIRRVNSYIENHRSVTPAAFQSLVISGR